MNLFLKHLLLFSDKFENLFQKIRPVIQYSVTLKAE